ncbi:FAD-dependent monooxygenase [Microbacterium invictum]|uniref:2-polyprenyl-6-methoxyphenol hydroxylase-like FAD-dependent oxidoreductase n=1 Tax=Microbacterium invictum TaxID=515415 RepID=A0AA40SS83_9MICO|nr:NAD(P)/FAD-dependent oxidoreductase [Microbacterium invictum]MBB4141472.1 2-polyprenyl-6-methoxyphenol hydroxylase-like FAD-dependent oxidoreductase [Microbacterium invictum]
MIGAGPVGMLVAGELTRHGVDALVLERRESPGGGTRAIGVHAPALAALEPSGVTARLLEHVVEVRRGEARAGGRVLGVVRFDRLSTRFPFVATLPQSATVSELAAGVPRVRRGVTVERVRRDGDAVHVVGRAGAELFELAARLVIVASGASGRDLVYRRQALRGREYRDRYLMADIAVSPDADAAAGMRTGGTSGAPPVVDPHPDADVAVVHLDGIGVLESFPLPGGVRRFVAWDPPDADPAPASRGGRLRAALRVRGEHTAADRVSEVTAFGVRRLVAPRLCNGRVFVIGDAAHEVSPIGGQGMNLGLLDAVGLAPLLATWLRTGVAPDPALRRWEHRRVASARTAARLAAVNTALGRALPSPLDMARRSVVRAMLGPATEHLFARAYAMGFDRGA